MEPDWIHTAKIKEKNSQMEGGKKTWDKEKREVKEGGASFNLVEVFSFNHYSTLGEATAL